MEWKGRDADSKLGRTHPDIRLYVFYGPDTGLAAERAMLVARRHLGDAAGADDILRLDGDALAEDPARLSDEAAQVSMFGGERVIRVTNASGAAASRAVESWLDNPVGSLVTVELGDVRPNQKLRSRVASAKVINAVAIGCYPDDAGTMDRLVDEILREEDFRILGDARQALVARLGPDRRMNRETIRMLTLYVGDPKQEITVADVEAALGDSSAVGFETIAFACLGGDTAQALRLFDKSMAEKTHPIITITSLLTQFDRFDALDVARQAGKPVDAALKGMRIFPHSRQDAFRRMADYWPSDRRATARRLIVEADIRGRSGQLPENLVYRDLLLRLGTAAQGMAKRSRRF